LRIGVHKTSDREAKGALKCWEEGDRPPRLRKRETKRSLSGLTSKGGAFLAGTGLAARYGNANEEGKRCRGPVATKENEKHVSDAGPEKKKKKFGAGLSAKLTSKGKIVSNKKSAAWATNKTPTGKRRPKG